MDIIKIVLIILTVLFIIISLCPLLVSLLLIDNGGDSNDHF